jgi:UDP-glucose 4-epimerase
MCSAPAANTVTRRSVPSGVETRLIPKLHAVQQGTATELVVKGDGATVRDFLHMAGMAAVFVLARDACEIGTWRAYNVASGRRSTARDVIEATEAGSDGQTRRPAIHPPGCGASRAARRHDPHLAWLAPPKSQISGTLFRTLEPL